MLDEPMAGVNPTLGLELLDHCRAAGAQRDDLPADRARPGGRDGVSDLSIVMSNGTVIASGPPDEVRANPDVIDAYLGSTWRPAGTPRGVPT